MTDRNEWINREVEDFCNNYDYHYGTLMREALERCWDEAFEAGQQEQHESGNSL